MTADLSAIRARLAAATPGEWVAHEYRERGSGEVFLRVVETYSVDVIAPDRVDCTSYCYGGTSRYTLGAADADLIAHAPADLAALCDEVERLRASVERVRELHSPEHYYGEPGDDDCPHDADYDGPRHFYNAYELLLCEDTASEEKYCGGCSVDEWGEHQPYPCPTLRALDGAE